MELSAAIVCTLPVGPVLRPSAEQVVIIDEVGVPRVLRGLGAAPYRYWICPNFDLGKDNAALHWVPPINLAGNSQHTKMQDTRDGLTVTRPCVVVNLHAVPRHHPI